MNINEQKRKLLEKLGSGGNTKIGYSDRSISMNINRDKKKTNTQNPGGTGCKGCSRKSRKT